MDHLCYLCLVFVMLSRLFIVALWSPEWKGLISWLLFVMFIVILLLSHWYPGTGVVLDCIVFWSLLSFLLCRAVSLTGRGQLVKLLITLEPHGIFGSIFCIRIYFKIIQPLVCKEVTRLVGEFKT